MIPKIEFRYSWIYDNMMRESPRIKKILKKQKISYPSQKKIFKYIDEIEKIWKNQGDGILKEISKTSGLKWKEQKIICYVRGVGIPFSDPLTMRLYKNKNDFIDTLTHELIHQIQIQLDHKKWDKWWEYVCKKHGKEPMKTKTHISVHAIHAKILLNLFGEKRLKREIKSCNPFKDYRRSWEIVQEEGHEKIIKKFKELTK